MNFIERVITYFRLGILNFSRVVLYRVLIYWKVHPVLYIKHKSLTGIFFNYPEEIVFKNSEDLFSLENLKAGYNPFSGQFFPFDGQFPNWHKNYFNGKVSRFRNLEWWKIPDFDNDFGDIKNAWELSRYDWVVKLSALAASGKFEAVDLLNLRLSNWVEENQPYRGVNWKCGQEASIRLLHLIFSSMLLGQLKNPSLQLLNLVEMHVKRIAPTLSYAIAQNNNHGTSEAAALFIGGHFLSTNGKTEYRKFEKLGRYWLDNRADKLFSNDGCFSQYSINYHRLALDTFSFCEVYRRVNSLENFSERLIFKIKKATQWLEVLTDFQTGDAPNIGANDGALLFHFFNFKYRDFRHCVQWANFLFFNKIISGLTETQKDLFRLFDHNFSDLNVDSPISDIQILGNQDGFYIFKNKSMLLVFRRPIFIFRPSHADALHLDLWINGENVLRDGGSFSYFTDLDKYNYYKGTSSHNTIIFDGNSQMPSISKFLFGSWLKECDFRIFNTSEKVTISSGYKNSVGVLHKRTIHIYKSKVEVLDYIDGNYNNAILQWRVLNEDWNIFHSAEDIIEINFIEKSLFGKFNYINCSESLLYNQENDIKCIEFEMGNLKNIKTIIKI